MVYDMETRLDISSAWHFLEHPATRFLVKIGVS